MAQFLRQNESGQLASFKVKLAARLTRNSTQPKHRAILGGCQLGRSALKSCNGLFSRHAAVSS